MITPSPVKERAVIDIRSTVLSDIVDDLLAMHGLPGTDAVASLHGMGNATVAKVVQKGCFPLFCIGDVLAYRLNLFRPSPLAMLQRHATP